MNLIRVVVSLNIIFLYLIGKSSNIRWCNKNISLAMFLGIPTALSSLSSRFSILNKTVLTTNFAVVASLVLCFAFAINLRFICGNKRINASNSNLIILMLLSGYAVINGILLQQSWLAPLGIFLIQFNALRWSISSKEFFSAVLGALFANLFLLFFATFSPGALEQCRLDKCLVFKNVFSGLVGGNGLGIDLYVFYCTLLYTSKISNRSRFLFYIISLLMLSTTSSRTGIISFIFCIVCYELNYFFTKRIYINALMLSVLFYSSYPLWGTYTEKAFTERGYLWLYAKSLIHDVGFVGYGTSFWTRLGESKGFVSNYGIHNLWLDVLIALGFLGLSLFICVLAFFYLNNNSTLYKTLVVSLIFSGMTESTFILWKLYPISIVFIVLSVVTTSEKSVKLRN